jgi:hypothetical protein
VALDEGRELLGANGGLVALPVDDGSVVELVASFGFSDEETAAWRRFPLSQRTPIGAAIEDGVPVFLRDGEREVLFPDIEGRGAPTASMPLRAGDQQPAPRLLRARPLPDEPAANAATMGEQCAYALSARPDAERRGRGALACSPRSASSSPARSSPMRRCAPSQIS